MAFELRARIGLDNSPLVAGLEQSKRHVSNFKGTISSHIGNELAGLKAQFAAAFGVAAIASGIRSVVAYADEVDGLSQQLQLSHREVERLMYVAETSGTTVQKVMRAMGHEAKEFLLTQEQINEKLKEFDEMGLGIEQIAALDALGDKYENIGRRLRKQGANELISLEGNTVGLFQDVTSMIDGLMSYIGAEDETATEKAIDKMTKAMLGRDEDVDEQDGHRARLQAQLDRAEREKKERDDRLKGIKEEKSPLEREKTALNSSFARQFDSLARIGGFMQNTDQQRVEVGKQTLQAVQEILKVLKTGGDSQTSFL